MISFNYSYDYDPPAPVVEITLVTAAWSAGAGVVGHYYHCHLFLARK